MKKFNSIPSSIKVTKNGVEYLDNCDKVMYYIEELIHAANREVGKYVVREARKKLPKRTGRARKFTQYFARKKDLDLQIGYKPSAFYGGFYEVGTEKTPKIAPIYSTVAENIETIQRIQGQYLSELNKPTPSIPQTSGGDEESEN